MARYRIHKCDDSYFIRKRFPAQGVWATVMEWDDDTFPKRFELISLKRTIREKRRLIQQSKRKEQP